MTSLMREPELWAGGAAGALAVVAGLVVMRLGAFRVVAGAGALTAAAAAGALAVGGRAPAALPVGLALLGAGGAVRTAGWWRRGPAWAAAAVAASVPGALVLSLADLPAQSWPAPLLTAVVALAAPLVGAADDSVAPLGLGPALFAVSAVGVLLAVPDTERAMVLAGSAAAVSTLGWPLGRARLGEGGASAATGLLVWVAVVDGRARAGSVVAAVACLGLLLVWAAATRLRTRPVRHGWPPRRAAGVVATVQVVVAIFTARVAGPVEDAAVAGVLAGGALLSALIAAAALAPVVRAPATGSGRDQVTDPA